MESNFFDGLFDKEDAIFKMALPPIKRIRITYIEEDRGEDVIVRGRDDRFCAFSWDDGVLCIVHDDGEKYINGDIVASVEVEYE